MKIKNNLLLMQKLFILSRIKYPRWRLILYLRNNESLIVDFLYLFEKFVTVKCVVDAQLLVSVLVKFRVNFLFF